MIISKKRLHKRTGCDSDYLAFSRARSACKELAAACYNAYILHVDGAISSNPKIFWSHMNNLRRTDVIPSKLKLGDDEASSPNEMCNLLAHHFSSVYSEPLDCERVLPFKEGNVSLSLIQCSAYEVLNRINALDIHKGCGPDGIPPSILRHCSDLLCDALAHLFSKSLYEGVFPSTLKSSYIVPIFKDGCRETASNYRPITIQSSIAKIFEAIVLHRLKPLFTSFLIPEQHGFSSGRSTITNLVVFEEFILSAFSGGLQVDAIYLDCSKAFDKVDHAVLISKLQSYGVMDPLLSWLRSYLSGRVTTVRFANGCSDPFGVVSGIPQGSLLGPFLFNLYMNDISEAIESEFLMFADDIKLFDTLSTNDCGGSLQRSLDGICNWCSDNKMQLNAAKCVVLSFYRGESIRRINYIINGTSVQRFEVMKDLGVCLNRTLTPDHHVEALCSRASKLLGFLWRGVNSGLSIHSSVILYKSLLRPVLEYASVVWKPYFIHHVTRLERIQRRFVRLVGCKMGVRYMDVPVDELMTQLDLCQLETRRDFADLVFLYRLISGSIDCPALLSKLDFRIPGATRSTDIFVHCGYRTNYLKQGPMARLHRLGNVISTEVDFFNDKPKVFKDKIMAYLKTSRLH